MGSIKVPRLDLEDFGHQVDNSTSTIQRLYQLYCDPVLSDLQLIVGQKSYFAHKLILSISSDVFKTMLTNPTWPEAYTDKIYLEEEPHCGLVFEDFLQYLYTGKVHLSHTSVLPVIILADKYNISDLSAVCVEYMCNHLIAPSTESCVLSWLNYSVMCNHRNLEKVCESYITANFQYVMETDEFLTISSDLLLKFLKSSDIVITSEISLYQYAMKWVEKNILPSIKPETYLPENLSLLMQIVSSIRQCLMSREDLLLFQSGTKQIAEYLHKVTGVSCFPETKSEQYQNLTSPVSTLIKTTQSNTSPRIYTCDAWCTEISVPNVNEVQPGEILGAFYSTPCSFNADSDESWDWHIDLYPRGVLFRGCMMIGHYGNHSIDEVIYERVRLAISSNSSDCRSVKVTVLVYGLQNGVEYVVKAITKTCLFTSEHVIHHVNDLVAFSDLESKQSPFLLGEDHNEFKIKIIIRPFSSLVT